MRKTLTAALIAAAALTALPAAPASADCNVVLLIVTGQCANACTIVSSVYNTADVALGDVLPDYHPVCLA